MYCHSCGAQLDDNVKFCNKCGAKQLIDSTEKNQKQKEQENDTNTQHMRTNADNVIYADNKNPWIALVLSLLIVGLGQFYNGDIKKGIIMFAAVIITSTMSVGIVWFIIALYSAWDAWMVAKRERRIAQTWFEANMPWKN